MSLDPNTDVRELPDDPALPGLVAIRAANLDGVLPGLGLGRVPVEVALRGHAPGRLATLEVRTADHHLCVKSYAKDPTPEVELNGALALELAEDRAPRVPPLVAWERSHRLLVLGWLEGATAE